MSDEILFALFGTASTALTPVDGDDGRDSGSDAVSLFQEDFELAF